MNYFCIELTKILIIISFYQLRKSKGIQNEKSNINYDTKYLFTN